MERGAATATTQLPAAVADLPARVYVLNERDYTISIIDPATMGVLGVLPAGVLPEHVGPDWDLSKLFVSNYFSYELTVLDARTGSL